MKNTVFSRYKDIHKGKRVFLIGNGPSLADTNLDLLQNEYSIAMNRISMIYGKNRLWRPTYYLFSSTNVKDKTWGSEWLVSVIDAITETKTTAFIASLFKPFIDPDGKHPQVHWFDSMSETKPTLNGEIAEESFSTEIVDRIDKSGTTMNLALQLAYHMGFSEIVILGADLGWTRDLGTTTDPNHFDKNYRANISNPYKANMQMRNVHKLALSIFNRDKPEVKLYNASIRTVLDTYPIIEYIKYVEEDRIVARDNDMQQAEQFWDGLVYEAPKSSFFTISLGLSSLKRVVKWLIRK
jgi:hypothetical protein